MFCSEAPSASPSKPEDSDFEGQGDWEQGTSINVLVTDNLKLQDESRPFNFIWIAASGKHTIVKVNTLTGEILGEYKSGPDSAGPGNPSRTTVDNDGSLWVANRNHNPGTVLHIGLVENNQCEDRNGNGVIDTSTGEGDVLSWDDESGERSVATAEDECIVSFTRVSSGGTRHLSLDKDNNLWVGGLGPKNWDLLQGGRFDEPNHGSIIQSFSSVGYGGYGGLIDKNNVLWSSAPLLRWNVSLPLTGPNGDPVNNDIGPPVDDRNWAGSYSPNTYGLCIDSTGNVWATDRNIIHKFSPDGVWLGSFDHGGNVGFSQGCVVGLDDDVWVAHSLSGASVGRISNNGTLIGVITVGQGPTGVAVDAEGKIWSSDYSGNSLSRIDPSLNGGIGAVDFTLDLGPGATPYNYGDMTGSANTAPPTQGSWTFVYNSSIADREWGILDWDAETPSDSEVIVEARSSNDTITYSAYETAMPGVDLSLPNGQYLEIRVLLIRASTGESPVVNSLDVVEDVN